MTSSNRQTFGYPVLPPSGLANRLFPWARCRIYCLGHHIPMLAPTWSQVKIGPLLRRERDLRIYHNLFKRSSDLIAGSRKQWILLTNKRVQERTEFDCGPKLRGGIVIFSGLRDYFGSLNGKHKLLLAELRSITRKKWLDRADEIDDVPIAIHVRLGDMQGRFRKPIEWYVRCLRFVRSISENNARAYVVSDGNRADLARLLEEPETDLVRTGSAISDLLFLTRGKVLIVSGCSSFGAWASFLGQMPTMTHTGNPLSWFNLSNIYGNFIGEFDPDRPDIQLMADVIRSLDGGGP